MRSQAYRASTQPAPFVLAGLLLRAEEEKAAGGARSMTIVPRGSTKCSNSSSSGDPTITITTTSGGSARAARVVPMAASLSAASRSSRSRWLTILLGCYAAGLTIHLAKSGSSACQLLSIERRAAAGSGGASGGWWSSSRTTGADFRNPSLAQGPMTVVAISQSRTSSTVAFNLARILLERLDPTTVSGWETDILGLEDPEFDEWKAKLVHEAVGPAHNSNVSMVVKSHLPLQPYLQAKPTPFDFILTSYRSPYEAICSEACKFHQYLFDDAAAANHVCEQRATTDEEIRRLAARAPRGSLHIDTSLLWSHEGLMSIAEQLVEMWDIVPGTRGGVDTEAVVADVLRLTPPPPGVFPMHAPRTLLHPQHNTGSQSAEGKATCKDLVDILAKNPSCRRLHERYVRLFGGERKIYRGDELTTLLRQE